MQELLTAFLTRWQSAPALCQLLSPQRLTVGTPWGKPPYGVLECGGQQLSLRTTAGYLYRILVHLRFVDEDHHRLAGLAEVLPRVYDSWRQPLAADKYLLGFTVERIEDHIPHPGMWQKTFGCVAVVFVTFGDRT
ncbi:MAG: hypothetical protein NZ899_06535 [Thermoguttaceae bacterium]|nr:hypothetical protein [Thermoguttaceae bacterium]MDW8079181.1 hypothetical protein [Thermoguttaceae bacterium]